MSYERTPFSEYPPGGSGPGQSDYLGHYEPEEPEGLLTLINRGHFLSASKVSKDMTFDVIEKRHLRFSNIWVEHRLHRVCYKTLKNSILTQKRLRITRAVCLGLGSFTGVPPGVPLNGNVDVSFQEKVLWQLIAFESWIDQLRMNHDIKNVYFQDPAFSALDEIFLESQGYKILRSPQSETEMYIDRHTFLFTPGAELDVEESCLSREFPALYFTSDLTIHTKYHTPPILQGTDPRSSLGNRLPAKERPARRKLLQACLERSAIVPLLPTETDPEPPARELFWLQNIWIYYKPDHHADRSEFKWGIKDEDCYTYEEAQKIWRERGVM